MEYIIILEKVMRCK